MTGDADTAALAAEQAELAVLRCNLGAHLALMRQAAGVTQPQLAQALDRTRSAVSKVEHGTRGMPAGLWKIADETCRAEGVLVAEHAALIAAEQDYRGRCRIQRRAARQAAARAQLDALQAAPVPASSPALLLSVPGGDESSETRLISGQLAKELLEMITRLVRSVGRRQAIQMTSWALAAVGLSGLNIDECTRVIHAVQTPARVDAHVIENLAATLAHCKRLEDALGPCEIFDTVLAQYAIVRRLLKGKGGCPDKFVKPLRLVESNTASTIGACLINLDQSGQAKDYFERARKAAHDAGNPACAAYAAANASLAAFHRRNTPTALDMAAAARSLAARTNDNRLKALAEQAAAAAYALDGQYNPCMSANGKAHDLLTNTNGAGHPDSLAYWVHHGTIYSQRSLFLCLLGKPRLAVQAASNARDQFNRTFAGSYTRCQIRLGHALVLDKEITEAAHVLGNAATHAGLAPRLTAELHATRTLMQPWANTPAIKTLDTQLHAYGLMPSKA